MVKPTNTGNLPELHAQVYERLKTPLITLMAAGAASQDNQEAMYGSRV